MVKKEEAERAFQKMFGDWAAESGIQQPYGSNLISYYDFKAWVDRKGYSHYFEFRSTGGADACVERWFDAYFKQIWMN
ncbi:hypothetical protein OQ252_03935 [Acetobacter farinalis]|uniref:Uncharacterized protein n=1 Tax=Acetobacter farinalis TaxID=1260984 RepID=A0ABT3Q5J4_9PROT|nr:hypothetical protein [Acetobacter farinalis]MCX2560557.1 hypothetical protein [Acetobacter farinalis]NHO29302.1 hypothetical protein [Acetobacter farinalis]